MQPTRGRVRSETAGVIALGIVVAELSGCSAGVIGDPDADLDSGGASSTAGGAHGSGGAFGTVSGGTFGGAGVIGNAGGTASGGTFAGSTGAGGNGTAGSAGSENGGASGATFGGDGGTFGGDGGSFGGGGTFGDAGAGGTGGTFGGAGAVGAGGTIGNGGAGGSGGAGGKGAGGASGSAGKGGGGSGGSKGGGGGVIIDGTCRPLCAMMGSDPDGDGWGWENNGSCVVATSPVASGRTPCVPDGGSGGSAGMGGMAGTGSGGKGGTGGAGTGSGGTSGFNCSSPGGGQCPSNGSYSCPSGFGSVGKGCGCEVRPNLGANKCELLNAGADVYMLASAMMETPDMDAHGYPLGDVYPDGTQKVGDAFNAGVCKQNWFMIRNCYPPYGGMTSGQYMTAAALNDSAALDVAVYNACRAEYGTSWWAGHRNGQSGLSNPNTQDIQNFKAAMDWTYQRLSGHETDNVRFWVSVPAIE